MFYSSTCHCHFTSWHYLCRNPDISGGRQLLIVEPAGRVRLRRLSDRRRNHRRFVMTSYARQRRDRAELVALAGRKRESNALDHCFMNRKVYSDQVSQYSFHRHCLRFARFVRCVSFLVYGISTDLPKPCEEVVGVARTGLVPQRLLLKARP
eukprot:COSAG02_NODE_599_length_19741_cov_177.207311_5_plen_152_part_00